MLCTHCLYVVRDEADMYDISAVVGSFSPWSKDEGPVRRWRFLVYEWLASSEASAQDITRTESILLPSSTKKQNVFAGVIGLCNTSPHNLVTEIGPVICFPEFQRTFVNTNAIGILLRYCLNLPEEGGLGLRRVQWSTHPANTASVGAAERMGMTREGTMRWRWVLAKGKEGKEVAPGRGEGPGRDSVMLAACWDDWENGGRELVEKQINR
ncbi:N-acetyltransferase domain-containing protein [Mycena venus]|uniref:N-acetyltransferase domain-containing protein n=1 Tax=Mycena venus TaxID=2733690 RepID=A0A8H6XS72_9AGAR|nr:N-acetyltransferase domain-containing protein [Mycena venus]